MPIAVDIFPAGANVLSLPVPPSLNAYLRHRVIPGRKPRAITYKTAEAKEYQLKAANSARVAGYRKIGKPTPIAFYMVWYRARKAGDLDNRLKVVIDSLQGVLFDNDGQIGRIVAVLSDAEPGRARVEVSVVPLDATQIEHEASAPTFAL